MTPSGKPRRAPHTTGAPAGATRTIDRGSLPGLLGFQLRLAQIAVFRDFARTMGALDITPGLYSVLVLIDCNPGLKQTELARAVQLDRSTIVPIIDSLERRGLVRRRAVAHDRRSNALELTVAGTALLKQLKRRVAAHEKRLARDLDPAERAALAGLLQRVFPEHR
jgi:DNA-binding MarR family transcriptional regulator